MNRTDHKVLCYPEPPDKPRTTLAQKNLLTRVARWVALKIKQVRK